MPRSSEFFGVVIFMYYNDHNPPHFHAEYAGSEALIAIETLETLEGGLPRRPTAFVLEWAALHREALRRNWERARNGLPLAPIDPLSREEHVMLRPVRVRAAQPLEQYHVRLEFTDGSVRDMDLEPYLHGPIFEPIRADEQVFRSMRVDPRGGTITWDNGADIDPDVLYKGLRPAWTEPEPADGRPARTG